MSNVTFDRITQLKLMVCLSGLAILLGSLVHPVNGVVTVEQPIAQPGQSSTEEPKNDKSTDAQEGQTENQIEFLIKRLDADGYLEREEALENLAAIGEPAIGPLALQSFQCSPETQWRIKKTLEAICVNGDEGVLYKALGILKLRFDQGSFGNVELNQSLAKLKQDWRLKRKKKAFASLRKQGAIIVDPLEDLDQQFNNMQILGGGNVIWVNGGIVELSDDPRVVPGVKRRASEKQPSEDDIKLEIKVILAADVDENRDRVFGKPNEVSRDDDDLDADPQATIRIAMQNQVRANAFRNQLIGGQIGVGSGAGISIEFNRDWKGSPEDFDLVRELDNVQSLTFVGLPISDSMLRRFGGNNTLTKLVFDACELTGDALDLNSWPRLTELEFKELDIHSDLVESCSAIGSLQMLTFNACSIQESALASLDEITSLRGLQFKETIIEQDVFDTLAQLERITYVNFSVCKFKTVDYKKLKSKRPNLQIAYTAQGFFGVRGPVNVGMARTVFDNEGNPIASSADETDEQCIISDVIADSGAERAGIKIGDVIESVNGQEIESFDDLRLHIAQHRVGDEIDVQVNRKGETLKLKVELASQKTAPRF